MLKGFILYTKILCESNQSGERPSLIFEMTKQRPKKGGNFM